VKRCANLPAALYSAAWQSSLIGNARLSRNGGIETDLVGFQEGNMARYHLRPSLYKAWHDNWADPWSDFFYHQKPH